MTYIGISGDTDSGSVIDLANRKITVDLDAEEWITIWFENTEVPEFEIPESPFGTILSILTMMIALIITQNKHKIQL